MANPRLPRGHRIALMAMSDNNIADTSNRNECVNDDNGNKRENMIYSVSKSVRKGNNTGIIDNEKNLNPNSSIEVLQDQSSESLFDITNIPIMFIDDFVQDVSEFNLENYVSIQSSDLNDTIKETAVNVLVDVQQPTLQNKLVDYSSSSESENNEKKIPPKSKTLKRFESDYSFHEDRHSEFGYSGSEDIEKTYDTTTDIVGNSGLRKTKKESRKKESKLKKR